MEAMLGRFGLKTAPVDYIGLSVSAIRSADHHLHVQAKSSDSRNFYRHQCGVLMQKLSQIQAILTDVNEPWPRPALRELYRVVKNAETLIKDCCNEPCLKAALRQGDRIQAFTETFKEIAWCTSVVYYYNIISLVKSPSIEMEDFPQARVEYREQFMLEKAAQDDRQALRSELESWTQHHLDGIEVCGVRRQGDPRCLAAQILRRWNAEVGVAGDTVPSEADRQSVLWDVDDEILQETRFIAPGSFGTVFETRWLGDKYALKIFKPVYGRDMPGNFLDETNALAQLNHRHIVRVISCSEEPRCSMLMELMSDDLSVYMRKRIKKGTSPPFALSAAIDLMLQVAEVMTYLHSRKMTHRDLKSMNILVNPVDIPGLSEEGYVFAKLADFGLAKTKRDVTSYSHLTHDAGTRKWMAPEIFSANADDVHLWDAFPMKADVYSFGIVCFEILSGEQPFQDVMLTELYKKLTAPDPLRPQLPATCPRSLALLIQGCWDADPRKRPEFTDVCTTLRYLNGLLMTDDQQQLLNTEEMLPRTKTRLPTQMPRRPQILQEQGPWGQPGIPNYYVGPSTGIRAVKLFYIYAKFLSAFQVEYDLNGESIEGQRHGDRDFESGDSGWIKFDYPNEYLVQVKGSTTTRTGFYHPHSGPFVTSLTFITNRSTYGPYGDMDPNTAFETGHGKVVGFFGYAGDLLDSFGVFMVLDKKDP